MICCLSPPPWYPGWPALSMSKPRSKEEGELGHCRGGPWPVLPLFYLRSGWYPPWRAGDRRVHASPFLFPPQSFPFHPLHKLASLQGPVDSKPGRCLSRRRDGGSVLAEEATAARPPLAVARLPAASHGGRLGLWFSSLKVSVTQPTPPKDTPLELWPPGPWPAASALVPRSSALVLLLSPSLVSRWASAGQQRPLAKGGRQLSSGGRSRASAFPS